MGGEQRVVGGRAQQLQMAEMYQRKGERGERQTDVRQG